MAFIIAAQDQSLPTRWYQHNVLKKPDVDPKCWLCGRFDGTIDHLVSGFPELPKTEYAHRHNKAAAQMHWKMCKEFGIEVKERWYENEPKTVTEKNSVTILWDMLIHNDRTITANRQGIVLNNKKDKTCLLVDKTIPLDTNTSVKATGKITKYKDLEIEVERILGAQNNNSPSRYGSPWHHQEGHGKLLKQNPWQHIRQTWTPKTGCGLTRVKNQCLQWCFSVILVFPVRPTFFSLLVCKC